MQSKAGQIRSANLAPSLARGEQRSPAASNLTLSAPQAPFLLILLLVSVRTPKTTTPSTLFTYRGVVLRPPDPLLRITTGGIAVNCPGITE